MAELTNAMKGVIQSSTVRTSSTYASTDLIQLYDSNNEPTIKINKDDLMAAVKASLPSLLSDQGTSGTAFPSIASGVLGSMTAANFASVLGENLLSFKHVSNGGLNANNCTESGWYYMPNAETEGKNIPAGYFIFCTIYYGSSDIVQIGYGIGVTKAYWRQKSSSNWSGWREISTDIPSFYKDYSSFGSLVSAVRSNYMATTSVEATAGQWMTVPNIDGGLWCLWLSNETPNKVYFVKSAGKVEVLNSSWYTIELQISNNELQVKYYDNATINFGRLN